MWSTTYKGYYINGYCDKGTCEVLYSPSGYGYEWRKVCKSLHAAKLAISKHIKSKV
jgi:hypothetical protein